METPEAQSEVFETARDVLENLLELLELPATVTMSDEFTAIDDDGNASSVGLNIEGEDLGILIGRRGQTMVSLQHIVRLIVSHKIQSKIPIVLDVEGYKQRRYRSLQVFARDMADQVKTRGTPFALEPMSAYERRIVHMALADHPDVITESIGQGEARRVVIQPKEQ